MIDFLKQKEIDDEYLDYDRATKLVKQYYTTEQLTGARCSLVYKDLQSKLLSTGQCDISYSVFKEAVYSNFPLRIWDYDLPNADGIVESTEMFVTPY